MTISMSVLKQWGTSIVFHFLPFTHLSSPCPLPSLLSLSVKKNKLPGLGAWLKGWTQFTDLGAICSPWLKGSVNISLAKYWYQFSERCHLVAYLGQNCVYKCVRVLFSATTCPAIRHKTHRQWQCHLISSAPALLSCVCIFIIEMTLHVFVWAGACVFRLPVWLCLCVYA